MSELIPVSQRQDNTNYKYIVSMEEQMIYAKEIKAVDLITYQRSLSHKVRRKVVPLKEKRLCLVCSYRGKVDAFAVDVLREFHALCFEDKPRPLVYCTTCQSMTFKNMDLTDYSFKKTMNTKKVVDNSIKYSEWSSQGTIVMWPTTFPYNDMVEYQRSVSTSSTIAVSSVPDDVHVYNNGTALTEATLNEALLNEEALPVSSRAPDPLSIGSTREDVRRSRENIVRRIAEEAIE